MRSIARAAALLLALPLVPVVLAALAQPAGAAPATCVTTYTKPGTKAVQPETPGFGYSVDWIDIQVTDTRVVLDVDWGFDVAFGGDSADLAWVLNSPQSVENTPSSRARDTLGPLNGGFVMDDEAAVPFSGTSPPSGRYRPGRASAELDGRSAAGQWRLLLVNEGANTGTWGNYTLTLTVDCDADKDGVADVSDNCPIAANLDQSNIDDDSLGDACDLDIDGDTLANTVDSCPTAAAATTSGCPVVARTVSLRYARATKKLKAVVRSDASGCRSAVVTLFRVRPGKDTKLVAAMTTSKGRWTRTAPKGAGRYYVKVGTSTAAGQADCAKARSKAVRVR